MGSLVLREVSHDAARSYPWPTMLGGSASHPNSVPNDSSYQSNAASHSSQPPSSASRQSHANSTISTESTLPLQQNPVSSSDTHWHSETASFPTSRSFVAQRSHPLHNSVAPGQQLPPSPRLPPSRNEQRRDQQVALSNTDSSSSAAASPSPSYSPNGASPPRIKVRDLNQIQTLVNEDVSSFGLSRPGSSMSHHDPPAAGPQYEISGMPVTEVIEMVAGVLTKITTSNDVQHEHLHAHLPTADGSINQQTASVIAFHGKNKPNISILSYLSRIHKYCPTTYEVFVSLLVYFDRMTNRVNSGPMQDLQRANQRSMDHMSLHNDLELRGRASTRSPAEQTSASQASPLDPLVMDDYSLSQLFVVDSFNIHRLVIAGVTCASKFFSDVFYTNSRYAKVGGLPQAELNHLELQFLLLNDFRLSVPVEELEAYGTMLVEFYAREVISQRLTDGMEDVQPSDS